MLFFVVVDFQIDGTVSNKSGDKELRQKAVVVEAHYLLHIFLQRAAHVQSSSFHRSFMLFYL